MSQRNLITKLLGISGWKVEEVRLDNEDLVLKIERSSGRGYRCSRCGEMNLFCYDHVGIRRVRDFPAWGRRCYIEFNPARVECSRCGIVLESLEWIEPMQRQTLRYERYIARLCDVLPVLDVARFEGLDKNTVYRIDRKWLGRRESLRPQNRVAYLGIDEIAIRKGQRYATVFYDLERKEVIGMVKGRSQRKVSGFFRRWGKEACRGVVAVCMDLWSAYLNSVRKYCRKAAVVFDKFHVYGYLSRAVDDVRRQEQTLAESEGRAVIKGARWLLLRRLDGLGRKARHALADILALNKNIQKGYLLKEEFEAFYHSSSMEDAAAFLEEWAGRCYESGLKPFKKVAKRLLRWRHGILAYFEHHITNAVSEGINNTIKVIKRRSYGFHDLHYFYLKILAATGVLPHPKEATHTF